LSVAVQHKVDVIVAPHYRGKTRAEKSHTEWQIGETMAEVLRERLVELETLEATSAATEDTINRLAFVRKMLIRFDASMAKRPA
jgi:hypothetical protein